jgi:hypothetical protein
MGGELVKGEIIRLSEVGYNISNSTIGEFYSEMISFSPISETIELKMITTKSN